MVWINYPLGFLKIGFNRVVPLLSLMGRSNNIKAINQKKHQKIMVKKDWALQHLKLINGLYEDKIVNTYLIKELSQYLLN